MGRPRLWTDEQILEALRRFGRLHQGRAPYQSECCGMKFGRPSYHLLVTRFGSAREAFHLAGLRPNDRGADESRPAPEPPFMHRRPVKTLNVRGAAQHNADVREFWAARDPKAAGVA